MKGSGPLVCLVVASAVVVVGLSVSASQAPAGRGRGNQEPGPTITVRGHTFTQLSLFQRNVGGPDDMTTPFPPHKVIGNIYYVGTKSLAAFLIVTPQGNILINSTYERNVRTIERSVTELGFKFSDVKILLGTHAHGDHQEGDALLKELTGAQVVVMREDIQALAAIKPGGKTHPIDRTIVDGDKVVLGGTTLVAHLTPGHTPGCTTWTMQAQENGKTFNVVFACSYRAPGRVTPSVEDEFNRTFKMVRSLPCDVPLGDHPAQYNLSAKHARLNTSGPNPFVDPANCWLEADIQEAMFRAQVQMQQKAVRP
jgi:metallo-beta-lactamase class B